MHDCFLKSLVTRRRTRVYRRSGATSHRRRGRGAGLTRKRDDVVGGKERKISRLENGGCDRGTLGSTDGDDAGPPPLQRARGLRVAVVRRALNVQAPAARLCAEPRGRATRRPGPLHLCVLPWLSCADAGQSSKLVSSRRPTAQRISRRGAQSSSLQCKELLASLRADCVQVRPQTDAAVRRLQSESSSQRRDHLCSLCIRRASLRSRQGTGYAAPQQFRADERRTRRHQHWQRRFTRPCCRR